MTLRTKRLIAVLCTLCMSFSVLAGCTSSKKSTDNQKVQTNESAKSGPNLDKKFTYTMSMQQADKDWANDVRLNWFKQKYNIDFEFLPITQNDWGEKVKIWIASGNMPDILWWDFKPADVKDFYSWAKQGIFKELPKFEGKYPEIQKVMDQTVVDEKLAVDGKKYLWPASRANKYQLNYTKGIIYRKDWAKKLNLYKDNDEYTWEEMKALAKAFIQKDPGGNGPGKTIGLGMVNWGWPVAGGIQQFNPYFPDDAIGYHKVNGKYVWSIGQPETLQGIKELKKLIDEGIIWPDQPFAKASDAEAKFTAGQLGMYYTQITCGTMLNVQNGITKNYPAVKAAEDIGIMKVKGPEGKLVAAASEDYWTGTLYNAKMSDEKMERLMYAWDYLMSKDGLFFRKVGIPGKDWEYEGDKLKFLWSKDDKGNLVPPSYVNNLMIIWTRPVIGFGAFDWEDPSYAPNNAAKIVEDYCQYYENAYKNKKDIIVREQDYDLTFLSAPNKDKYGNYVREAQDKIIELVQSSKDIEKDWNAWVKSKEPDVQKVLNELNTQLAK